MITIVGMEGLQDIVFVGRVTLLFLLLHKKFQTCYNKKPDFEVHMTTKNGAINNFPVMLHQKTTNLIPVEGINGISVHNSSVG